MKSILKVTEEEPSKKKKKRRKAKGIEAFMENEEEAQAFAAETKQEEVVAPVKKVKKSVNFNLEQNQVKEFDKTKKISENVVEEVEQEVVEKKTIAQTNMDDMVSRTLKKKTSTKIIGY